MTSDFLALRRACIEKQFSRMNDMQFDAVTTATGPLLILAGAGSGKTTVVVNRIANLIKYGEAYRNTNIPTYTEQDLLQMKDFVDGKSDSLEPLPCLRENAPRPWEILAITFTNKAAGELKERLCAMLGDDGEDIWAGTFHSTCARILRRYGDRLGYSSHFTIYDTDDSRRMMKECQKALNIDDKMLSHRSILNEISRAKDSLILPEEYAESAGSDYRKKRIAAAYELYQKKLISNDAMDFDDLMVNMVLLLQQNSDVLEYYQNRFRYIMVDEYQDTNHAQYMMIKLLAASHKNICVVGDDDQSIYRFRGATIENILNFEKQYPQAKVIRLEQNYRSTSNILNAANGVIKNNEGRKGKTLWTGNGDGEKVRLNVAQSEHDEARYVADVIMEAVHRGDKFSDHAVLYRMNAQSNALENALMRAGVPYRVIGGLRFYDRKEIKDVMSYLAFLNNPSDDLRLRRIINEPKRGIGDTTVNAAAEIAAALGESLFYVISHANEYEKLSRASAKLKTFCETMQSLIDMVEEVSLSDLLKELLEKSGYIAALELENTEEARDRIANVNELSSNIVRYEQETEVPSLSEFLEEVALITDLDNYDTEDDRTILMTLHSAKGLEFPTVFLVGLEEGIFPGSQTIYAGPEEMEEERRLAYVGITRAKKKLYLLAARQRMLFGMTNRNRISRFVNEIPPECLKDETVKPQSGFGGTTGTISRGGQSAMPSAGAGKFGMSARRAAPASSAPTQSFSVGERVVHKTFGAGMVTKATKMGNDVLLEIAFDNVGTKKLMANFAKITKE